MTAPADGRVFGGWVAALSDHIVSMCMSTALEEGKGFTMLDLQVKLFRPRVRRSDRD